MPYRTASIRKFKGQTLGKQGTLCLSQSLLGDLSNLRHPSAPQLPSDDPLMAFAVEVLSLRAQPLMARPGPQGLALLADGIAAVITGHVNPPDREDLRVASVHALQLLWARRK